MQPALVIFCLAARGVGRTYVITYGRIRGGFTTSVDGRGQRLVAPMIRRGGSGDNRPLIERRQALSSAARCRATATQPPQPGRRSQHAITYSD